MWDYAYMSDSYKKGKPNAKTKHKHCYLGIQIALIIIPVAPIVPIPHAL